MTTPKPTIDFDHHSQEFRDNWPAIARDVHETGRTLAWTDAQDGGYWVLSDWETANLTLSDWETFSSYNDLEGTGNGARGGAIPQMPYRLDLSESDPPVHTERRRIEAPFFSPRSVREWKIATQRFLDEGIDSIIESGGGDLLDDVISPTAARTTLSVLGYQHDWHDAADIAHKSSYILPSSPDYPLEPMARMREDFRHELHDRRANPQKDIISALAHGVVQGEPLTDAEGESMMNALVFGGFDTTVSAAAHGLIWLVAHPEFIPPVRDDEQFRKNAVEEMLRFVPPTPGVTRTAIRDTELLGQTIKKGERIFHFIGGLNRDPNKFDRPNEMRLDRPNASEHFSFSGGHHRCLGSPLAKAELNLMLETVLRRLEGLSIDVDGAQPYPSIGTINGFIHLPATFTAGPRVLAESQVA
jgi:cytochrome P450